MFNSIRSDLTQSNFICGVIIMVIMDWWKQRHLASFFINLLISDTRLIISHSKSGIQLNLI